MKKHLKILTALVLFCSALSQQVKAQACYGLSGCTNFANSGYNSENFEDGTGAAAATLEYDNFVSSFHGTIVRDMDGTFKVWGENAGSITSTTTHIYTPTPVTTSNFPFLTGIPLKAATATKVPGQSTIEPNRQTSYVVLTSDNKIWRWGVANGIFTESGGGAGIARGNQSHDLPAGIKATDVKMMFVTAGTIALTTCIKSDGTGGEVFVMSRHINIRGAGSTATSATTWYKVTKSNGDPLTGVIATRGSVHNLFALDKDQNLWTWGRYSYSGAASGSKSSTRNTATPVTPPNHTGSRIKMIGSTGRDVTNVDSSFYLYPTYYVLYEDGYLFSMGNNTYGQLGNFSNTAESTTWVQPHYPSNPTAANDNVAGNVMNDVAWISPQEHDQIMPFINIINKGGVLYNWGVEAAYSLGRNISSNGSSTTGLVRVNPGAPSSWLQNNSNSDVINVESGGHTTMVLRNCSTNFGYAGDRVNGSMGDNNPSGSSTYDTHFTFATNAIQVCGSSTVNASITPDVLGPYYVGQQINLTLSPSGGALALDTSALYTGTATLSGTTLTLTGAGNVRVNYTVTTSCGPVTVNRIFSVKAPTAAVTIPGSVWNDIDKDAVIDATETKLPNGFWAVLVDANNMVIASAKVQADGNYNLIVEKSSLYTTGNYKIILKNDGQIPGATVTTADTPLNNYTYTGTNRGGTTGNTTENLGILSLGDISTTAAGSTLAVANFGINLCNAGTTAPLVNTAVTNICDATSVNLNTQAHTGTIPTDTFLRWFTNSTHTGTALSGTAVTQAGAGIYYAFYYDSENNCYSPVSLAVTVTINTCEVCNAGTAPVPLSGTILTNQ